MSGFPLPETITYWVPVFDVVTGQASGFGVGIKAAARTASRSEEIITDKGKERMISKLAVYTDAIIQPDYMLAVGDFEGQALDTDTMDVNRVLVASSVPIGTTVRRVLL